MENKILELANKRKMQYELAKNVCSKQLEMKSMNDQDIRNYNSNLRFFRKSPWFSNIKEQFTFEDVYCFAREYYFNTGKDLFNNKFIEFKNEISKSINLTNFQNNKSADHNIYCWFRDELSNLVKNRKMDKDLYSCFEEATEMIKSGKFDEYKSVKRLN